MQMCASLSFRGLLLRAQGALTGQLTNIDESGATSMGYHSAPFVETHDPHSGEYIGAFVLSAWVVITLAVASADRLFPTVVDCSAHAAVVE